MQLDVPEALLEKHDAIQKGISEIMKKNGMGVNRFLVKKKDREIQIQDAFPEIREKGYLAEKIMETAAEAGVPVYEDDSLAVLLSQMKLGAAIPEELYQAVVEIYLYFLDYKPEEEVES